MPRATDIGIDIPGVGVVHFPQEMGMDAIQEKAAELSKVGLLHQHNLNRSAEADAEQGQVDVDTKMAAEIPRAIGTFAGPFGAMAGEAGGQALEMAGGTRPMGEFNPVSIAAQAAIPEALNASGQLAGKAAKGLYGSALKLSTTIKPEKRARILETGLNEGRIPSTGSIAKSFARQREIEKEISDKIATRPQAPINTQAVASRVDQVAPRFETVNPEADRAILQGSKEEFLRNYPAMGAEKAQDLKKKTYKVLGEKAYGEQKTASKEAEKALARGLKEELEGYFPELKNLNARDSALFDLNRALVRAANRIGNRDVLGIGIPIKTEAFGPAGFLAGLLDTPRVKSALAVAIDKSRRKLQAVDPRLGPGLTSAVTQAIDTGSD